MTTRVSRALALTLALALGLQLPAPALRAEEAPPAEEAATAEATWPTVGEMVTKAKPGEFLKYHAEQVNGDRKSTATVWAIYTGTVDNKASFDIVMTTREKTPWQPIAESAADLQKATHSFSLDALFQDVEPPRGMKVLENRVQAVPFANERIASRSLSGTKYTRNIRVQMPNEMRVTYEIVLWHCPDLPATGLAKYTASISTGLTNSVSSQTLVAASDVDPTIAEAQAKAAAEAARVKAEAERLAAEAAARKALEEAVSSVDGALAYSEAMIKEAHRVSTGWVPQYDSGKRDLLAFRVRWGFALLGMERFEEALALAKELPADASEALYFRKYVQAEAAYRGQAEAVTAMAKLIKVPEKPMDELKTEWFLLNPTRTTTAELLAHVRTLPDAKAKNMALRTALSRWDAELDQAQKRELVNALSSDEERMSYVKSATWGVVDYEPDLEGFDAICALYPPFKETPEYPEMRLTVLAQTGHAEEAKALLEPYLKSDGITQRRAALILEALGDERAAAYRWQVNEELKAMYEKRFAELKEGAKPWPDDVSRYVRTLAAMGDRNAAANAAKTYEMSGSWRAWIEPVVAHYGEGGNKAGAIAWRDSFSTTNPAQAFWLDGLKSDITLGFAEWELMQGNRQAYETLLAEATALSLKANEGIVAYNAGETDTKKRAWWRVGMTTDNHAPYATIAMHLVEQGDSQRLLAFLPQLKNEMPTTDSTKKTWEEVAKALAKQGDHETLGKVLLATPGVWEENWYTAVLSETVRLVAVDAGEAWVKQLADGLQKPNWKAEVLRAAIITISDVDKPVDAAAHFTPLKKAVEAGASNTHQAYGALALAYGYVRAGFLREGLQSYGERSTSLREGMVRRGYNGRAGDAVLQELGQELVKQKASAEVLAKWLEATENLSERAYLALGIAEGLHARGK